jgi:hypothetical protein
MRGLLLAGLSSAAVLTAGVGLALAHDERYPTTSPWGYSSASFGEPAFLGYVDSPNQECRGPRRIEMHRISSGRDRTIGQGRTGAGDYDWIIEYRDPLPRGRYYARVLPKNLGGGRGHDHLCRTFRSNALRHTEIS